MQQRHTRIGRRFQPFEWQLGQWNAFVHRGHALLMEHFQPALPLAIPEVEVRDKDRRQGDHDIGVCQAVSHVCSCPSDRAWRVQVAGREILSPFGPWELCCRSLSELEQLIGLFVTAVLLAAAARRVGAPYPVFLALGGAVLAFVPAVPSISIPPELALALFVAPVLLDAAYDASLRDLRDNWAPVTGLVVFAVGLTTLAVAIVVRALIPSMPWAPALVLGAVVAPPDAVAATCSSSPIATTPPDPHDPRRRKPAQ
jgi:hypothetical protein